MVTTDSGGDRSGDGCALFEAIVNANNGDQTDPECDAGSGGLDTIAFDASLVSGGPATILIGLLPTVTQPLHLDGPGADLLRIDGNGIRRILSFMAGADGSTVDDLTLTRGVVSGSGGAGGAIRSDGADLTLARLRITQSRAHMGGGIAVIDADLTVSDSEISGNWADEIMNGDLGAGILFKVTGSTQTLTLTNVTISGNLSLEDGGGVAVRTEAAAAAIMNLHHVTIAKNEAFAGDGGGLYLEETGTSTITATLTHVIVADNSALRGLGPDIREASDTTLTLAHSVVFDSGGFTPDSSTHVSIDFPRLSPLAFNCGRTRTHALLAESPARDLVTSGCTLTTDQRGRPRPKEGGGDATPLCDAGAFEDQGGTDFFTLTPCRAIDTRLPPGPNGGPPLRDSVERSFNLAGACGIPSSAVAIAVNVTAIAFGSAQGNVQLYESGLGAPPADGSATIVYYKNGEPQGNNAVLSLCSSINALADQADLGFVDLIVDVVGYYE